MITFDFNQLLFDKRKSVSDISKLLRTPFKSISVMIERGTIKPSFLALLETHFGDCSKYVKKQKAA
ncbi:MAG: hypothetical protein KGZ42_07285 [Melioribacter sp.]|nr:hypothetical protein [Melioribacter sp.]